MSFGFLDGVVESSVVETSFLVSLVVVVLVVVLVVVRELVGPRSDDSLSPDDRAAWLLRACITSSRPMS